MTKIGQNNPFFFTVIYIHFKANVFSDWVLGKESDIDHDTPTRHYFSIDDENLMPNWKH